MIYISDSERLTGRWLARYLVGDIIGIGGKGVVYEATHADGRRVALKLIPVANVLADSFRREVASIAALRHPHVVSVYEAGEADGYRFLAMELVDGATLQDHLREGSLTVQRALRALSEIASALDAAHAAGLVHRDVKPSNILISARGYSYLADFGVAKPRLDEVGDGTFVGTAKYAAPEQFLFGPVAPASDVYALAAIVYECLTGQPPFANSTPAEVVRAKLTSTPRPPSEHCQGGRLLDAVLIRGLAREPEHRFQSATEFIDDARDALTRSDPRMLQFTAGRGTPAAISDPGRPAPGHPASEDATQ